MDVVGKERHHEDEQRDSEDAKSDPRQRAEARESRHLFGVTSNVRHRPEAGDHARGAGVEHRDVADRRHDHAPCAEQRQSDVRDGDRRQDHADEDHHDLTTGHHRRVREDPLPSKLLTPPHLRG